MDVKFIVPDTILHLFILIGSVILKQWFKIGVVHRTTWVRHVVWKQTGPGIRKVMWLFSTFYISVTFPVGWYPALAQR